MRPNEDLLTVDPRAYLFFKENAGYIVGERAKGALRLAKAEQKVRWNDDDYRFRWENDDDADYSWLPEDDTSDHVVESCVLERKCEKCGQWEHVESLWGIFDADDNYRRVIEAELALQATT